MLVVLNLLCVIGISFSACFNVDMKDGFAASTNILHEIIKPAKIMQMVTKHTIMGSYRVVWE
jgi:hypothetical protein